MRTQIFRLFRQYQVESHILFLFLVVAGGLFAFIKLASEVAEGDTLAADRWLLLALRTPSDPSIPIGPSWLREAMVDVTALGGVSVLALLTLISAGYLIAARKPATAGFLVVAISSGAIASTLLKMGFARSRPDFIGQLVEVHTASFPSGHAMNSAVTYLTLGALLARAEDDRSVRIYLVAAAIFLTLVVGFSRVYLGVHWPSDVIGGWCVGSAWAVLCSLIARTLGRRRLIDLGEKDTPSPN